MPVGNGPFSTEQLAEALGCDRRKTTERWFTVACRLDHIAEWCVVNDRADLWLAMATMIFTQAHDRVHQRRFEGKLPRRIIQQTGGRPYNVDCDRMGRPPTCPEVARGS